MYGVFEIVYKCWIINYLWIINFSNKNLILYDNVYLKFM